jgi:hypothetical protein
MTSLYISNDRAALVPMIRFSLATADAHGLSARYGFTLPSRPQALMGRYVPDIYAPPHLGSDPT